MSSIFDRNILPEFDSIKDDDEEILWVSKPIFIPYFFHGWKELLGILFVAIWLFGWFYSGNDNHFLPPIFIWGFAIISLLSSAYHFLERLLSFSNTAYGFTNKRVIIRTGFIGTDFKSIDYDKISDIEVNVNIIERIFNVGTIRFFSGRTITDRNNATAKLYDAWFSIENPYQVFKMVKQTSVDIKTDFNYPNALRPESNPGYRTKYEPKR
jgi:membrane protein YdbS with pleckstrin-like domain